MLLWDEEVLDDRKPDPMYSLRSPSFKRETDVRRTSVVGTRDSKPQKVLNTELSTKTTLGHDTKKHPTPGHLCGR